MRSLLERLESPPPPPPPPPPHLWFKNCHNFAPGCAKCAKFCVQVLVTLLHLYTKIGALGVTGRSARRVLVRQGTPKSSFLAKNTFLRLLTWSQEPETLHAGRGYLPAPALEILFKNMRQFWRSGTPKLRQSLHQGYMLHMHIFTCWVESNSCDNNAIFLFVSV